ncbi:MAG: SusD/RagB family nutrient-binding outer membrane lipoprotein [Hyphomicrobiales bacterium]
MNLRKIYILILALGIITLGACNKWIDEKINIDPDRPSVNDVTMDLILPAVQARMAYDLGGYNTVVPACMWSQQVSGIGVQSSGLETYEYAANEGNNLWNFIYSGTLMDAKQIIILSKKEGNSPHFRGVAKILTAITLGNTTDVWGDIPYSQALEGVENLAPKFDKQEEVYREIINLLDQAIVELKAEENLYQLKGDLIFSGETKKWIAAAHTLKARYLLHKSKRDPNVYNEILEFINNGIVDNSGDCKFIFSTSPTGSNPIFQFDDQRSDHIRACETTVALLREPRIPQGGTLEIPKDLRLPKYVFPVEDDFTIKLENPARDTIIKKGSYFGNLPGYSLSESSRLGPAVNSAAAAVYFTSYSENELIKAEAQWSKGEFQNARTSLVNAVISSLQRNDVYDADWVSKYETAITPLTGEDLYKEIIVQRNLCLYFTLEVFNDFRRTNNALGLKPIPGNKLGDKFPKRYFYPDDEIAYNRNTPITPITEPVWWDKQ